METETSSAAAVSTVSSIDSDGGEPMEDVDSHTKEEPFPGLPAALLDSPNISTVVIQHSVQYFEQSLHLMTFERDQARALMLTPLDGRDATLLERDEALTHRDAAIEEQDEAKSARYAMIVERDGTISAQDVAVTVSTTMRSLTTGMIVEMSTYIDEHCVTMQMAIDMLARVDTLVQETTSLPPSERDAMLGLIARIYTDL